MVQREVADRLAAAPGAAHLRRHLGARPALLRGALPAQGAAHRLPPRAERRLRALVMRRRATGAAAAADRARARRLRPPPQGAGRLAGARRPALPTTSAPHPRRARSASANPPTHAPSGSPPTTGARLAEALGCERLAPCDRDDRLPVRAGFAPPRSRPAAVRMSTASPSTNGAVRELAYAKLNLVLHVGRPHADGMHPLCSLFASIDLADDRRGAAGRRSTAFAVPAWTVPTSSPVRSRPSAEHAPLPPLEVAIEKRIPVAAGLGGGSADAAAVLRAANAIAGSPLDADALRALAAQLGSDVPSQVAAAPRARRPAPASGSSRSRCPARRGARAATRRPLDARRLRRARPRAERPRRPRRRGRCARWRRPRRPRWQRRSRTTSSPRRWRCVPSWPRPSTALRAAGALGAARHRLGPDLLRPLRGPPRPCAPRRPCPALWPSRCETPRPTRTVSRDVPRPHRGCRGGRAARRRRRSGADAGSPTERLLIGASRSPSRWPSTPAACSRKLPDPKEVIEDVAQALGPWTYALVGVMAFLETGAFVGLIAPGETVIIAGGVIAGQGEIQLIPLIGLVWVCARPRRHRELLHRPPARPRASSSATGRR